MSKLNSQVKIRLILAMFFCSISLINCKKEHSINDSFVDTELINNVRVLANTGTNSKLAFSMLNADEKLQLIKQQLQFAVENASMNEAQKTLVNKIKESMPGDLYSNFSSRNEFVKKFAGMEKEALKLLGEEFMFKYFVTVVDINNKDAAITPAKRLSVVDTDVVGGNDCPCALSSDWCSDEGSTRYACGASFNSCKKSDYGCGTLFLSSCDGTCQRVLGEE